MYHLFVCCGMVCVCVSEKEGIHMCRGPMVRACVYWPISGKQKLDTECSPVCSFVETLGFHLGLESWLSFQEVFFLSPLYKQWKRDLKKMSQTHCFHCKHALSSFHQGSFQRKGQTRQKLCLDVLSVALTGIWERRCLTTCQLLRRVLGSNR